MWEGFVVRKARSPVVVCATYRSSSADQQLVARKRWRWSEKASRELEKGYMYRTEFENQLGKGEIKRMSEVEATLEVLCHQLDGPETPQSPHLVHVVTVVVDR